MYLMMYMQIICTLGAEYTLVEIADEPTPLARSLKNSANYFGEILILMVLVIVLGVAVVYLFGCYKYRIRICQLRQEKVSGLGWNLRQLRRQVFDLELEEAERYVANT